MGTIEFDADDLVEEHLKPSWAAVLQPLGTAAWALRSSGGDKTAVDAQRHAGDVRRVR
jgi:hypothetical protein